MNQPGESELTAAILTTLVGMWDKELPADDPKGDRLFVRWVDRGPDGGWDDWSWVGTVETDDGTTTTKLAVDDPGWFDAIAAALALGDAAGRISPRPDLAVWWCRSSLDGPSGPRVSDWAKETP
jgi:hypothetical protein